MLEGDIVMVDLEAYAQYCTSYGIQDNLRADGRFNVWRIVFLHHANHVLQATLVNCTQDCDYKPNVPVRFLRIW